jgi:hypothetical protein
MPIVDEGSESDREYDVGMYYHWCPRRFFNLCQETILAARVAVDPTTPDDTWVRRLLTSMKHSLTKFMKEYKVRVRESGHTFPGVSVDDC